MWGIKEAIKCFCQAIWADWIARMSGGFSVPFAAIATFASPEWQPKIWAVMAITCFLLTAFRVWYGEWKRSKNLEEQIRPKLKCSFDNKLRGCVVPTQNNWGNRFGYFRLRVETDGTPIARGCRAKLVSIKSLKDTVLSNETVWLNFDGQKGPVLDISDGAPEFVDIAFSAPTGFSICGSIPFSADREKIGRIGKYILQVVVSSSDGAMSRKLELIINWTGEFNSSTISGRPFNPQSVAD
jgi:hypothetical protein